MHCSIMSTADVFNSNSMQFVLVLNTWAQLLKVYESWNPSFFLFVYLALQTKNRQYVVFRGHPGYIPGFRL